MLKYALRRVLETIPTTIGIVLLTFVLFNVVGGSPAVTVLGKNASKETIEAFNRKYGYDKPLIFGPLTGAKDFFDTQFFNFACDICKGDFGYSVESDEPVVDILKRGVGPSLSLTMPPLIMVMGPTELATVKTMARLAISVPVSWPRYSAMGEAKTLHA
jgi:peptide/nickel transport system permease protein